MTTNLLELTAAVELLNAGGWRIDTASQKYGCHTLRDPIIRGAEQDGNLLRLLLEDRCLLVPAEQITQPYGYRVDVHHTVLISQQRKKSAGGGTHLVPRKVSAVRLFSQDRYDEERRRLAAQQQARAQALADEAQAARERVARALTERLKGQAVISAVEGGVKFTFPDGTELPIYMEVEDPCSPKSPRALVFHNRPDDPFFDRQGGSPDDVMYF